MAVKDRYRGSVATVLVKNASFNGASQAVVWLLLLVSTPYIIYKLGAQAYVDGSRREAAHGIELGFVGFAVGAFFISAEYQKLLWLFVFLTICISRMALPSTAHARGVRRLTSPVESLA